MRVAGRAVETAAAAMVALTVAVWEAMGQEVTRVDKATVGGVKEVKMVEGWEEVVRA